MKRTSKKALSILLTLTMLISLFAGLSITASATAAESFTMQIMGKDGTTVAWEDTWYFQDGTSENDYMDATFTRNSDGTGGEWSLVQDFTSYPGFESYGSLVYSGWRRVWPSVAVCKRGILLEDLIDYVETQSGYGQLRGDTGIQVTAADGFILPNSSDPATDGQYSSYFWGNATRYFYPDFYNYPPTGGDDTYCTGDHTANGIEVPTLLSMVGYFQGSPPSDDGTLEDREDQREQMIATIQNDADTD
jgi:hypothetical protein